jgi:peroxiredoxin
VLSFPKQLSMSFLLVVAAAAVSLVGASPLRAADSDPGPLVGAKFPHALEAPDQSGKPRDLQSAMGQKGVVVLFVRSADWCPFCKKQLADVNAHLARFRDLGLNVVSISVDDVAEIAAFASEQNIGYTMLADPEGKINLTLGIRDEQYPVGSAAYGVPRPIIYVLDRTGTIRLRYIEPTYRTRPDLEVVLRDAAALDL